MDALIAFLRFWYDFIIGDDWTVAAGVVAALVVAHALAARAVPAWWVMPLAVGVLLSNSLRRAAHPPRSRGPRQRRDTPTLPRTNFHAPRDR